jgi:hypothetical protein
MASTAYKDKFRRWINDYVATNLLDEAQESSDDLLDNLFDDALDEALYTIAPGITTNWTLDTFPSFALLKFGVLTQILIGAAAHSARNAVDYSDAGGVNVRMLDKWSRYLNLLPAVQGKWERGVAAMKAAQNFNDGWGYVESEYGEISW